MLHPESISTTSDSQIGSIAPLDRDDSRVLMGAFSLLSRSNLKAPMHELARIRCSNFSSMVSGLKSGSSKTSLSTGQSWKTSSSQGVQSTFEKVPLTWIWGWALEHGLSQTGSLHLAHFLFPAHFLKHWTQKNPRLKLSWPRVNRIGATTDAMSTIILSWTLISSVATRVRPALGVETTLNWKEPDHGPTWANLDQPGPAWTNLDQPGPNLDQSGPIWTNLDLLGPTGTTHLDLWWTASRSISVCFLSATHALNTFWQFSVPIILYTSFLLSIVIFCFLLLAKSYVSLSCCPCCEICFFTFDYLEFTFNTHFTVYTTT